MDKKTAYAFYKRIEAYNLSGEAAIDLIDDVPGWMKEAESWLNEVEEEVGKLSDELVQKEHIINLVKAARKTLANNEPVLTKRFITDIERNWSNAMHDKGLPGNIKNRIGREKGLEAIRKNLLKNKDTSNRAEILSEYRKRNPDRNTAGRIANKL